MEERVEISRKGGAEREQQREKGKERGVQEPGRHHKRVAEVAGPPFAPLLPCVQGCACKAWLLFCSELYPTKGCSRQGHKPSGCCSPLQRPPLHIRHTRPPHVALREYLKKQKKKIGPPARGAPRPPGCSPARPAPRPPACPPAQSR